MRQLKITKQITNRESVSLGKYFSEVNSFALISAEEEAELAKKIRLGDNVAANKLINANLRFVVSVSKQYQVTGVELVDLISAGNIGLIEAARRFDESRGFKFISYAVWWVRQSIAQYLSDNSRSIRLPINKVGIFNKLKAINADLEQTLERKPSLIEISDSYSEKFGDFISENNVYELLFCSSQLKSIDAPLTNSDDDSTTLSDMIQCDGLNSIDKTLKHSDLKTSLNSTLNKLSNVERFVIVNSFGIDCNEKTLGEIGDDLELTRERVRQIREKAIRKLKTNTSRRFLKEYL